MPQSHKLSDRLLNRCTEIRVALEGIHRAMQEIHKSMDILFATIDKLFAEVERDTDAFDSP